jgi:DNA-binding NarL/FixJ family response regulator
MKRILLAEHNAALRSALRLVLKTRFGLESISEASDMESLLRQLQSTNPDCIILDWELPGSPGIEPIDLLRSRTPELKIIVLSLRPESQADALASGAEAFVCKAESPAVIVKAIQELCRQR